MCWANACGTAPSRYQSVARSVKERVRLAVPGDLPGIVPRRGARPSPPRRVEPRPADVL
jgi:hypothetical protein